MWLALLLWSRTKPSIFQRYSSNREAQNTRRDCVREESLCLGCQTQTKSAEESSPKHEGHLDLIGKTCLEYSCPSVSFGSESMDSTNLGLIILEKKLQKVPRSKIWICHMQATIYIVFTFKLFVVVQSQSCVWLFVTPWTTACQALDGIKYYK